MKLHILFLAILIAACAPPLSDLPQPDMPYQNVAYLGHVTVSAGSWQKHFAVDGDSDTWWSADEVAPQWLEVDLWNDLPLEKIEFSVSQIAPGPATHKIRLENKAGDIVAWHRFDTESAGDGNTFALTIDPPSLVRKVRILTTRHQGWVAYREVRILLAFPTTVTSVVSGLTNPVYLTHAGDGSGRLFVLEQDGRIRIISDGVLLEAPFLDIADKMISRKGQNGLLGLAFPPTYAEHGRFFVTYTRESVRNIVSRFAVGPDPNVADPNSEEVILDFDQPTEVHPVGTIAFGPLDGYLYIAVGDGGGPQDADKSDSFLGKVLRIDVTPESARYAIPPDNPFIGLPGHLPEIWAMGLRNPWGFAFDPQSGALFVTDTGGNAREEVNYQPAHSKGGHNYGSPCWEGGIDTEICQLDSATAPIVTYRRSQGCAIVGGAVQRGRFAHADFCSSTVWLLHRQDKSWRTVPLARLPTPISSIGTDEEGNLYAVGYSSGIIYRIDYHHRERGSADLTSLLPNQ